MSSKVDMNNKGQETAAALMSHSALELLAPLNPKQVWVTSNMEYGYFYKEKLETNTVRKPKPRPINTEDLPQADKIDIHAECKRELEALRKELEEYKAQLLLHSISANNENLEYVDATSVSSFKSKEQEDIKGSKSTSGQQVRKIANKAKPNGPSRPPSRQTPTRAPSRRPSSQLSQSNKKVAPIKLAK